MMQGNVTADEGRHTYKRRSDSVGMSFIGMSQQRKGDTPIKGGQILWVCLL